MSDDAREEAHEFLTGLLPKSQHKKIGEIVDWFDPTAAVAEVEVIGARVGIEQVTAYGLDIGLDANGNAASVGFPYGAEVTVRRAS